MFSLNLGIRVWDQKQQKMLKWGENFQYLAPNGIVHFTSESMRRGNSHHKNVIVFVWTFLNDQKGIRIYSGDILQFEDEIGFVYFSEKHASFRIKVFRNQQYVMDDFLYLYYEKSIVIGHIFDDKYSFILQKYPTFV